MVCTHSDSLYTNHIREFFSIVNADEHSGKSEFFLSEHVSLDHPSNSDPCSDSNVDKLEESLDLVRKTLNTRSGT